MPSKVQTKMLTKEESHALVGVIKGLQEKTDKKETIGITAEWFAQGMDIPLENSSCLLKTLKKKGFLGSENRGRMHYYVPCFGFDEAGLQKLFSEHPEILEQEGETRVKGFLSLSQGLTGEDEDRLLRIMNKDAKRGM